MGHATLLNTDASDTGVGAYRVQDGEETVIPYANKSLLHWWCEYDGMDGEPLAGILPVTHFRYSLHE